MDVDHYFEKFAQRILDERTRMLANRLDPAESQHLNGYLQLCVFEIGGREFALDVQHVLRIAPARWRAMPVSKGAPNGVVGMYGYLTNLYSVVDVALTMDQPASLAAAFMLLLRPSVDPDGNNVHAALLADRVSDIVDIDLAEHQSLGGIDTVRVADGRLLPLLNPQSFFSSNTPGV